MKEKETFETNKNEKTIKRFGCPACEDITAAGGVIPAALRLRHDPCSLRGRKKACDSDWRGVCGGEKSDRHRAALDHLVWLFL